jgi:hypothetical protein
LLHFCCCIFVAAFLLLVATALQADEDRRTFMFVAEPSAQGWQMLMNKPTDRLDVVKEAFAELGGGDTELLLWPWQGQKLYYRGAA